MTVQNRSASISELHEAEGDIEYESDWGDEEWEIEDIVACRMVHKVLEYQVKWCSVEESELEWHKAAFLKSAAYQIKAFHLKNPKAPGPPRNLFRWIRKYEEGKESWAMDEDMRREFFKGGEM